MCNELTVIMSMTYSSSSVVKFFSCLGIPDLPVKANWYSGGPFFSMFPYPVADKVRVNCKSCLGDCHGHFITDLNNYMEKYSNGCAVRARPPSEIIAEFFKETNTCNPNATQLERLQKECLLPADEINVYLKHLATVAANRQKGVGASVV